mgnify:CR=1 FL=1
MTVRPLPLRGYPSPTAIIAGLLATVVAAAVLLPAIYLVVRVSEDWSLAREVMTASRTMNAARDTVWFAAIVAVSACALAVPPAWLTSRTDLPFAKLWFVLLSLPLAIPSYVSALTIVLFLGPRGTLQGWLEPLGVERLPSIYGFWGAWLALVFFTYPYVLLPVRAAMLTLDRSFEEASRSLGRSATVTFLRVVLPQLRPALAAGAMLVALYTLSDFGAVSTLRYNTLSRLVYLQYEGTFNRQAAAALGLLLAAIAFALVTLEALTRGRARYHSIATQRQPGKTRLGHWKWPACAYLGAILLIALVMPLGVLGHQVYVAVTHDVTFQSVQGPALNSVYLSLLAAVATIAAALPIGFLAARRPGLISGTLERASYAGYALPGIVIGLALVFFGANYAIWAYQTLPFLVFAFVVRFLPEASGPARASFLKVNPRTEEAGRSLGRSPVTVFFRVTLPQLIPGLSAAGGLVFLTALKELPITLLLSPIGFDTLAVQVWMSSNDAYYARAAFSALALVLVAAIPVLVLALRERSLS